MSESEIGAAINRAVQELGNVGHQIFQSKMTNKQADRYLRKIDKLKKQLLSLGVALTKTMRKRRKK